MRVAALLACPLAAALAPCGGSNVALVTPMVAGSNAVDYGALRSLLEWHVECGTAGVVALGTTGEASTLSGEERDGVLRTAVDVCGGVVPVVAGTGTIDTKGAIAMGRRAAELGADGTLVVTPYYVKPPQAALVAHFAAIADAVDLPMILYNVPGRTGVDLLPATVAEAVRMDGTHPKPHQSSRATTASSASRRPRATTVASPCSGSGAATTSCSTAARTRWAASSSRSAATASSP